MSRIVINLDICNGLPTIEGTRINRPDRSRVSIVARTVSTTFSMNTRASHVKTSWRVCLVILADETSLFSSGGCLKVFSVCVQSTANPDEFEIKVIHEPSNPRNHHQGN